ncbi:hypothetical protein BV25DRAFT_1913719 [Artomyces pyxidatus]|uniref:Uncharacterized protein n=1 Tax=Artomyces pyxidatus TaxID=48021 RepID=A0ACB8TA76_9AGAM|nr:hypothetical protein BV25DRAFT_1913719 [Artomyces pyxidatus]
MLLPTTHHLDGLPDHRQTSRPNINYRAPIPVSTTLSDLAKVEKVYGRVNHQPISRLNINYDQRDPLPTSHSTLDIKVEAVSTPSPVLTGLINRQQRISRRNGNYRPRQGAPPATPTDMSSINWWPYPAWSETVAAPSTTASMGASDALTSSASPTTSSSLPSTSSSSSTASVITISALPPSSATDPPNGIRTAYHGNFNILYLTPVFAVAALTLGALTAFLAYRWYSGRGGSHGLKRDSSFEPGPPYMPTANSFNGSPRADAADMQEVALHTVGSPSKYTRHGAARTSRASSMGSSWLSATMEGSGSHPRSSESGSRDRKSDGFLAPPIVSRRASSTGHTERSQSRLSSRAVSPDPSSMMMSPETVTDDAPYESLRHTSIRRGILDRLNLDSERRSGSEVGSEAQAGRKRYPSSLSPREEASSAPVGKDETEWVAGSGFRIVEEDPDAPGARTTDITRQNSVWRTKDDLRSALDHKSSESWLAWTQSWSPASSYAPTEDKFTAIPPRKSTSDKKSVSASIGSPRSSSRPAPSLAPSASSVLPTSPSQVAGPFGSKLMFSPPLESTNPLRLKSRKSAANSSKPATARTTRKLHALSPPQLPLPTTAASSPYRNRLMKSPPPSTVPDRASSTESDASSAPSFGAHRSPAQRHAARSKALNKVEEILARSYSERDIATPSSPTMFGAVVPEDEDFSWAVGIEQRLAAMEDGRR